jgi:hypothetical protein
MSLTGLFAIEPPVQQSAYLDEGRNISQPATAFIAAGMTFNALTSALTVMSADLGLDALDGVGNLIADAASVGLDSIDRLPGGLATRLQFGEQPLPAL